MRLNKRQKEILEELLADEKRALEELEEAYDDALAQINGRIENLLARQDADMQHVIYQVEYQRQLKTQVQAILETLQSNEFDTISQYLTKAYENGFMGTMYDLHGQGIPMIFPIDQAQVADAIRHQTKLSSTLYTALGLDVQDLSKKIAGEISRGMSSGQGYDEMARNISAWARIPQNNAMRIARTEAHRIQCRAAMDAQYKAKDKGADVVKQWDAALDGDTRPNHRKLDGQIRELDEPFEVAGMKAMYPGDFGDPGEDCNCRCALLQRARWALDSGELENLRQRAEVMGEYDSYNEFRDSYNRALNELYEDSQPVRSSVQKRKKGPETLENTGNNGIIESDILIPRSAGAKARNYDISLPDGGKTHLTEGTRITSVETIAGKGRERQIDVIDYLLDTYGGEELEWQKKKGIGYIDFEGESYRAELHWYEEPTAGRHEWKVKPDADGNWFYDD
jgi:SPP1 gp7 family putative phage head morphogenesis protein